MGRIAPEIGALSSLRELALQYNNLQGLVPSALNTLSQLTEVDLEGNMLVGNPFNSLTGATNLRRLRLSSNQFGLPITSSPAPFLPLSAILEYSVCNIYPLRSCQEIFRHVG
jgi:Leucine-rich repeat (LRR) protein